MSGIARPWPVRAIWPALAAALICASPVMEAPAKAQPQGDSAVAFDIPAGRLSSSIRSLARQAGISVASRDSGIRRIQARSVRGALTPAEALRQLLSGTPYQAVSIAGGFRIEKRPRPARAVRAVSPVAPQSAPTPPPVPPQPIIVEGTKRAFGASDYPGGVKVITLDDLVARGAGESLDEVLADVPSVSGTALGSGRNKIFLRGIADSSFNGPTQSTIGLYLGEQRLTFSAPNPDLRLYDMETVELLEGPQGTLYGAGTIAGLVRANPRAPDPSGVESEGWLAGGFTRDGGFNWDTGAVANLPLSDEAALRVVGYGGEQSGYIDDPTLLQEEDINAGSHYGGRAALGFALGPDWDVTLSAFGQHTEADDGQYIDGVFDGLARSDRVAQPFRGRVYGSAATTRGVIGTLEVTSTTGFVDSALRSAFDSSVLLNVGVVSPAPGSSPQPRPGGSGSGGGGGGGAGGDGSSPAPSDGERRPPRRQAFVEDREIRLISHETRVSGGDLDTASWIVGVSALRNRDRLSQIFVNLDPDSPDAPPFADQSYQLDELSLFGEGSYRFASQWTLTGGARLLYTNASGERSFGADTVIELAEDPVRVLPALALSWKPDGVWMAYIRAQQGFRTGGVTIERDPNNTPQTAIFDPDKVRSYEAGVRAAWGSRRGGVGPVELALTLYRSDWRDIQADILDRNGFPLTRNVGDGTITGLDGSARVRVPGGWDLSLAGVWNDTKADRLLPDGGIAPASLPNIPEVSGFARLAKLFALSARDEVGVAVSGRYVGRSFLDIDQRDRIEQGDYGALDAALWWEGEGMSVRLEALNLTNTRGNRFAFGNPFKARNEDQRTPLRPFTVRLQISLRR